MNPNKARLPERLTISFVIWGLFDTGNGPYHDIDRMVREHVERGFNCIRMEDGAGLTHDIDGRRRGPVFLHTPFGPYQITRQNAFAYGEEGPCDVMERLIELCRACRKYGVCLILSSWYFLHTYWYLDNALNRELQDGAPEDMFKKFARYHHYILRELEERGLDGCVAAVEIFNEVSAIPTFIGEMKGMDVSGIAFHRKHEEALAWLRELHPNILFAVDNDSVSDEQIALLPDNLQVFNGHNYYLWDVYAGTLEAGEPRQDHLFSDKYTAGDVALSRAGLMPLTKTCALWYDRVARCNNVIPEKIPALEAYLSRRLDENRGRYLDKLDAFCRGFVKVAEKCQNAALICGEGVTYCSRQDVLWEEKSDAFWDMIRITILKYREIGLWGTLLKTCCGPEDPCWTLCKDRLREMNELFLM